MKLWLLTALHADAGWYDCNIAVVVRAPSPHAARRFASELRGDEGAKTWRDASQSSCQRLCNDGQPGVILRDFNAG